MTIAHRIDIPKNAPYTALRATVRIAKMASPYEVDASVVVMKSAIYLIILFKLVTPLFIAVWNPV